MKTSGDHPKIHGVFPAAVRGMSTNVYINRQVVEGSTNVYMNRQVVDWGAVPSAGAGEQHCADLVESSGPVSDFGAVGSAVGVIASPGCRHDVALGPTPLMVASGPAAIRRVVSSVKRSASSE